MEPTYKTGTKYYIISPKLRKTLSPFQGVEIFRVERCATNNSFLVQVRDLRGELLWFGENELQEAIELYERHAAIVAGKRARLTGLQPQSYWEPLMLRGYYMQMETESLGSAGPIEIAKLK